MKQAKLWKVKGEEHYLVAIPEKHYTKWMDETKFKEIAYFPIPSYTRFTKVSNEHTKTSKEDMIEELRTQLDYWRLKKYDEMSNELNNGEGDFDKFERYKRRVVCCSIFLKALQENALYEDTRALYDVDIRPETYITKS